MKLLKKTNILASLEHLLRVLSASWIFQLKGIFLGQVGGKSHNIDLLFYGTTSGQTEESNRAFKLSFERWAKRCTQMNAAFVLEAKLVIDFDFAFSYAKKKLRKWTLKSIAILHPELANIPKL